MSVETQALRQAQKNTVGIAGVEQVAAALSGLSDSMFNKIIGSASRIAIKPTVKAAKGNIPVRLGFLKRAITTKQKKYKRELNVATMIGARNKKFTVKVRPASLSEAFKWGNTEVDVFVNPSKYLHLIEKGFTHYKGKQVKAKRPLRNAIASTGSTVIGTFGNAVGIALEKEIKRQERKNRK